MPSGKTYGTFDLGGASAQICFFVPSQDISEGLFKLQIGSQRHWNVYAKSYLQFGHVSARHRHFAALVTNHSFAGSLLSANSVLPSANKKDDKDNFVTDDCLFSGYSEYYQNDDTTKLQGPTHPDTNQIQKCKNSLKPLLRKDLNSLCVDTYGEECSFGGHYQPTLPTDEHGE